MDIRLSDNPNLISACQAKEFDLMVKVNNPIFDFFVVDRINDSPNEGYRLGRWGISSLVNLKDDKLNIHGKSCDPFVVGFSDGNNMHKGSALVLAHTTKYYHAFHEIFPRILFAKSIDPEIKVYLYGTLGLRDGGNFFGMSKGDIDEFQTLDHYHPYFLEFLEYFNIDYVCINEDKFFPTSFDTAYVFYEYRHESSLDLIDPTDAIIHPDMRVFDEDGRPYDSQLLYNKESSESYFDSINILKDAFPTDDINPDKNIYISRRNYKVRQYTHEDKLEEYFKLIGYDIVYMELIPWADQIKLIQQSKNIVCPIGTSVVNTQLCNSNNNVIALGIRDVDEENFIETMNKHYSVMLEHYDIPFHPIDIPENTSIDDAIKIIDEKLKEIN
jgi:hypothetical protein